MTISLPQESDMLAGVIEDHWSDASLLVYADWLEERGDPRGPFLRRFLAAFGKPATRLPASGDFPKAWLDVSGVTFLGAIRKCKLAGRRDELAQLGRTTLLLETKTSSEKKIPIGHTKFGGCPDLPKGIDWPVCTKGSPAFLAQFNLADLANTQAGRRLPWEGMLHFFVFNDEENGCAGPGLEVPLVTETDTIRVIHTTDLAKLRRLSPPDDLGEYNQVAPTREVAFVEAFDFRGRPDVEGSEELENVVLDKDEWEATSRTTNHFFGYPVYFRMDEPEEIQRDFVHLITFANAGELPFAWGDGADLYFYIREADLRAARFDSVAIYSD